jgi:hypothetical protein
MKGAEFVVDWSFHLRANMVPDQCALRSLPYANNLLPHPQIPVHTLLEAETERFAANSSRVTSQNPFAWAFNGHSYPFKTHNLRAAPAA